jgi:hypothetical protein
MIDNYYEKNGRRQYRVYCDTCHALVGDTGPGKKHLPRSNQIDNICPICRGKIFVDDAPK